MNKIKTFRVEAFDSKNTAVVLEYTDDLAGARAHAKWLSIQEKGHKAILRDGDNFEGYEMGNLVAWSFPNGLIN